jgi:hypothetical protein
VRRGRRASSSLAIGGKCTPCNSCKIENPSGPTPLNSDNYPDATDANLVGTYPALAKDGGGYVWHPERGSDDIENGNDYYFAFATYAEASAFSIRTEGAEEPLALIRQVEYIDEPNPGDYRHVREERIAEWPVEFLRRPRRTANTIPDFLSPRTGSTSSGVWRE